MSKFVTVATSAQKAILEQILIHEMASGFWGRGKKDNAELWADVQVKIGTELGTVGFKPSRNYNFLNAEFMQVHGEKMFEVAAAVDSSITQRQLRKQLIMLNQIIGSRASPVGGEPVKLNRGSQKKKTTVEVQHYVVAGNQVSRSPAVFSEEAV